MRPEMPIGEVALAARRSGGRHPGFHRIEGNPLAGFEAGEHLDCTLVRGGTQADLAQPRCALRIDHIDCGELAAMENGIARHHEARSAADHEMGTGEDTRIY